MGYRADSRETKRRMPRNRLAGSGAGEWGAADVVGDIARGYAFGRVAASTAKTYEASLEDVGELEVVRRERVLVVERDGGDGACGRVGRVHGVLLRGEREQRDDNRGQASGD